VAKAAGLSLVSSALEMDVIAKRFSFGASPVWWLLGIPWHSQGQGEGGGAFCLTKPTSLIPGALVGHGELAISLHRLHTVPEAQLLNIPSN